ncbi:MAG: hypothetical protein MJ245_00050 [Clostridia bacterium]|nr:hypothetical protein [Clostridia bacterium]
MSEKVLHGRDLTVKYGISHEDGKLRFTFCGVENIDKHHEEKPLIFSEVLAIKNIIQKFSAKEIIEYQKKEVFSLEACMCAYLIDYIKSGNDLTHVTEENLTNIYNSEIVRANFETVGYEATHSIDRDEFFEKESQALSIIHEAFKLNEESYIEPQDNTKEHIILTQRNDELDGDALDALLEENRELRDEYISELKEESNVANQELFRKG